jgi:hypothetical protein
LASLRLAPGAAFSINRMSLQGKQLAVKPATHAAIDQSEFRPDRERDTPLHGSPVSFGFQLKPLVLYKLALALLRFRPQNQNGIALLCTEVVFDNR